MLCLIRKALFSSIYTGVATHAPSWLNKNPTDEKLSIKELVLSTIIQPSRSEIALMDSRKSCVKMEELKITCVKMEELKITCVKMEELKITCVKMEKLKITCVKMEKLKITCVKMESLV